MFDHFGLEFSILKLGTFIASSSGTSESNKVKGWAVEGIGMMPAGQSILLMLRGGMFVHDFDTTISPGGGTNESVHSVTYGLGVQYGIGPGTNFRLEWQQFKGLGTEQTTKGDVDMLSLGVLYQF
jgi:hypothetical protein